jgi:putative IMPACT (imprinted ancient) family translation regulator
VSESHSHRTVAGRADASVSLRGSRFIGHVAPTDSVADAEAFVERARSEYAEATHNVPAYRVRVRSDRRERPAESGGVEAGRTAGVESGSQRRDGWLREYASDDGEPSGSAGKPILNVLQGEALENVVCVVTRFYGGTNLGTGGLVRAYGRTTKAAIEAAGICEKQPQAGATVIVSYDDSGTVRAVLESESVAFEARYEEQVSFRVEAPEPDAPGIYDRLRSATNGRVRIERDR